MTALDHDLVVDINSPVETMFSGLSALVVEDVGDGGDVVVSARARGVAVPCPVCGTPTARCTAQTPPYVAGRTPVVSLPSARVAFCPAWVAFCAA
ncbi:hypothetical protein ACFC5Z_35825 [Streptomyces sp. NPDC056004]|uniref:hypothetical protein n=1 Tax=unclassified Streptomyces TaxID=2593676 RepID=UPI0035DB9DFB